MTAEPKAGKHPRPEIERIRAAAVDVLGKTLPVLIEEHVLPRPAYSPWIRMARDYFGDSLRGGQDLPDALDAAFPDRFRRDQPRGFDLPWSYNAALIEASVAAATRAGEPYRVDSPSVQQVVEEFLDSLARDPQVRVGDVVSDVTTGDGRELALDDVRIIPAPNGAERLLEQLIQGAGFLLEREDAIALGSEHTAVILGEATGPVEFEALAGRARLSARRVLTAIRLATGTTAHALAEARGHSRRIHGYSAEANALPYRPWSSMSHRTAVIDASNRDGLLRLATMLARPESEPLAAPLVALGRFSRSLDEPARNLADHAVDLAIGLEAALGSQSESEISLRLRSRAATLLAGANDSASAIYDDVKALYDVRSIFVHGVPTTRDRLWRRVGRVSSARATDWRGEQLELAIDRWRDLLRRAILLRFALADAGPVVWPLAGNGPDVDRVLHDGSESQAWRTRGAEYWASLGLPGTLDPPPPLAGLVSLGRSNRIEEAAVPTDDDGMGRGDEGSGTVR